MDPLVRAHDVLQIYAEGFADACRKGTARPPRTTEAVSKDRGRSSRIGGYKVQLDEAVAFLRALDAKLLHVEADGRFWLPRARRSSKALHLIGRNGDCVCVHTEYLIQIGAFAELVLDHGWDPANLDFECGPFDIEGGDTRPKLAVEAKARVNSASDSLISLRDALLERSRQPDATLSSNHRNKWNRAAYLTNDGPVWLWLVADGARWSFLARRIGAALSLDKLEEPPAWASVAAL